MRIILRYCDQLIISLFENFGFEHLNESVIEFGNIWSLTQLIDFDQSS